MNASGGIRAMHRLIHELRERGYDAYCLNPTNPLWNEKTVTDLSNLDPETIVVYPEGVTFNPTGLRKRVRWILYFSELNKECPEETVFTWDKLYLDVPNELRVNTLETELFTKGTNDEVDCYWVHKGAKDDQVTSDMIEITDSYPETREELAELLKRTKTLYSYDYHSQLNYEALLCGCNVVMLPQNIPYDFIHAKELEIWKGNKCAKQIDKFIEITQNIK